ncbi:hypothetical protein PG995_009681 [Apiospora arundinis]
MSVIQLAFAPEIRDTGAGIAPIPPGTIPAASGSVWTLVELTKCPDGTFCCGERNSTCCGTPEALSILPALGSLPRGYNVTNAESAVTVTAVETVFASSSDKASPATMGSTSSLAAGLGTVLGVVILASSVTIICLIRQIRSLNHEKLSRMSPGVEEVKGFPPPPGISDIIELPAYKSDSELSASPVIQKQQFGVTSKSENVPEVVPDVTAKFRYAEMLPRTRHEIDG